MSNWGGVNLLRGWGPLLSSACHSSRSPFLFPSIYISKQAMSRSKTVTNDEAFHHWLAWYAEIVYGEVSLIISRWVCCLALLFFCAAGLLSLFHPKFVSRGKTSLAGDVPVGLAGECLCHPGVLHASELITQIPRPAIVQNPNEYNSVFLSFRKVFKGFTASRLPHYRDIVVISVLVRFSSNLAG